MIMLVIVLGEIIKGLNILNPVKLMAVCKKLAVIDLTVALDK